jgi:hypothetical protein
MRQAFGQDFNGSIRAQLLEDFKPYGSNLVGSASSGGNFNEKLQRGVFSRRRLFSGRPFSIYFRLQSLFGILLQTATPEDKTLAYIIARRLTLVKHFLRRRGNFPAKLEI